MTLPAEPLAWAVKAFRDERVIAYALYRRYLAGDHPIAFATPKFRSAFGSLFEAFSYNRCGTVVDAHADRLRVAGFGANDDEGPSPIAQQAEDLWNANEMDVRQGQVEVEAFGLGDGYVSVEVHPDTGDVVLWPQRPENIRVHWDGNRPGVIDLAAKQWVEDDRTYLNLYFVDRIEKYRSRTRTPNSTPTGAGQYEPYQPEGDTAWPMPLNIDDTVPIFHVANNARINSYGESEIGPILRLQDGLNKTLMDMLVTMEFAAFPQRILINVDVEDDAAVESIQRFQAAVDRMLTLTGSSDKAPSIAEFTAANIQQYLDVAESWDVRISRITKVPVHYLTMNSDFPSGRALRMAETPWVAKLEDRQQARGGVYAAMLTYGLRLQGETVAPGDIRVNWEPASPLSEEDVWEIALLKQSAGMPFAAILREMGYEPEQLAAILEEKAQAVSEAQRVFDAGRVPAGFDDDDEGEAA